jgi:hypothetical protein
VSSVFRCYLFASGLPGPPPLQPVILFISVVLTRLNLWTPSSRGSTTRSWSRNIIAWGKGWLRLEKHSNRWVLPLSIPACQMRRSLILGVHTGLSTSNPNFQKAEIRTESRIDRCNNYPCIHPCASMDGYQLIDCLKDCVFSSHFVQISFKKKRSFQRSRGSELAIQLEQFLFLLFLKGQVDIPGLRFTFNGRWPIDYK